METKPHYGNDRRQMRLNPDERIYNTDAEAYRQRVELEKAQSESLAEEITFNGFLDRFGNINCKPIGDTLIEMGIGGKRVQITVKIL